MMSIQSSLTFESKNLHKLYTHTYDLQLHSPNLQKYHELKVKLIEVWTYKLTLAIVAQISKGCEQNIFNIFVTLSFT